MSYVDQDQGSVFAELAAKLDLHIGSVSKLTDKITKQMRKPPAQPVFGRTVAVGTAPSSGILVLRFPLKGPDQGHFWYVRQLIVGGATRTTMAAGSCDVFVSASDLTGQASLAAIGLGDERDFSSALPNNAFYGRGEIPLRMNEELFVVISGSTSGQQYVAALSFEDFEEGATAQDWSM